MVNIAEISPPILKYSSQENRIGGDSYYRAEKSQCFGKESNPSVLHYLSATKHWNILVVPD